ncbi:MAG: phosphoglucosamine mutase [Cellvibrionaceae bacterium]|nr:phosphoglucosamine mutase [Cellvibrionaceae bacterium]
MTRNYFGTDGIRGRVGDYPVTPDFVLRLGWAVGRVFSRRGNGHNLVLIGKDTRISGYMFESALQAGLINAGVDVGLLGPMPTPAIAYLTETLNAQAGIVISASHNVYSDNGIKLFSGDGAKLPDELELEIEAELDKTMTSADALGKARRIDDARGRYIEFCKASIPRELKLKGLHIVVDCAHGASYQVAPSVFRELGATVDVINAQPDGLNINKDCGSTAPQGLQARVLELKADLGIALDGDGDRVVFVDHRGELVDGDELLYVISAARHQYRGCTGVVGTLMSNYGLEMAFKKLGIPFSRAGVGDRYVLEMMREKGWLLGGESSGHIICSDVTTTGDGIVSALQVVNALHILQLPLADAKRGMSKLPQTMINVSINERVNLCDHRSIHAAIASVEQVLQGRGRVLLRPSGTEPVIRVMVEGEDDVQVSQLAKQLASKVKAELSSV